MRKVAIFVIHGEELVKSLFIVDEGRAIFVRSTDAFDGRKNAASFRHCFTKIDFAKRPFAQLLSEDIMSNSGIQGLDERVLWRGKYLLLSL